MDVCTGGRRYGEGGAGRGDQRASGEAEPLEAEFHCFPTVFVNGWRSRQPMENGLP